MSNIRVREFTGLKAGSGGPAPEDLAMLAGPEYCGPGIAAEQVHVRSMLLAHDQYDRTYERFPKTYLERFAETLPGKSVLPGHNTQALPLGRFFKASVEQRTESFPVPKRRKGAGEGDGAAGEQEGAKAEIVAGFEESRRKVAWVAAGFYFPQDEESEALRRRIDTGVYRSVSIGFRFNELHCDLCKKSYFGDCSHLFGHETEDGLVATGTYAGNTERVEALEGSLVYLGAQPMARLTKALQTGELIDPAALAMTPYGEDLVALKEAEHWARGRGHARKAWALAGPAITIPSGMTREDLMAQLAKAMPTATILPTADTSERGSDPAEEAADEEKRMNLLERARKLFGLADTATEDEVFAAMEKVSGDAARLPETEKRAEITEAALKAAEDEKAAQKAEAEQQAAEAARLKPLAAIGEKALTRTVTTIKSHALAVDGQESAVLVSVIEHHERHREYEKLCEMESELFGRRCVKFPASPSGVPGAAGADLDASGDRANGASRKPRPQEHHII